MKKKTPGASPAGNSVESTSVADAVANGRASRRNLTPEEQHRLTVLFEAGKSNDEIGRALGRKREQIARMLNRKGLRRRECGPKVVQGQTWEEWRREKHGGTLPVTTCECPNYKPNLPAKAFPEDVPIGRI